MNQITVCRQCGSPDEVENMVDGICTECIEHKPPNLDDYLTIDLTGDCV